MKKIFIMILLSGISLCLFSEVMKFDKDGNLYFEYGTKGFKDGDVVDTKGFNQIRVFDAIVNDDWSTVEEELDTRIDINSVINHIISLDDFFCSDTFTLLSFSVTNKKVRIAEKLIERGADVNIRSIISMDGRTVELHIIHNLLDGFIQGDFSENLVCKVIEKMDKDSSVFLVASGQTCSPEICKKAISKFFEYESTKEKRVDFLGHTIGGIMAAYIVLGDSNARIREEFVDSFMVIFENPWVLENKDVVLNLWDGIYADFCKQYPDSMQDPPVEIIASYMGLMRTL